MMASWSLQKFFKRFWGEPVIQDTPQAKMILERNQIVKKAGESFQAKIYDRKVSSLFIRGVEKKAKASGLDPKYLFFLIFEERDSWPEMPEYLQRSLETIFLIFRDQRIIPDWSNMEVPPSSADRKVNKALRDAGVIGGRLVDILQGEYVKINDSLAHEIVPYVTDPQGNPLTSGQAGGVLCKMLEKAIMDHYGWFHNQHTMKKLILVFKLDTPNICQVFK